MGECELEAEYNGFKGNLPVVVISGQALCFVRPQLDSAYFFRLECNFNLTTMDK